MPPPSPAPSPAKYRALTSLMAVDLSQADPKTDLRNERWIPIGGTFEADPEKADLYVTNGWVEAVEEASPQAGQPQTPRLPTAPAPETPRR